MRTALDDLRLDEALDRQIWNYLVMGAHSLVNVLPEGAPSIGCGGDLGITPA
jgi:hemoglobin